VTTPAIGVLFLVFICQSWLEGPAMQVEFDHISSSEGLLRQVREEEFIDDAWARDAHATLLVAGWVGCHYHATPYTRRSHWHVWAVGETAPCLTFWALLELIGWEMQARLNLRMIKGGVLFAARHKSEPGQVREDRASAVLA
jgi:hypothetical protein